MPPKPRIDIREAREEEMPQIRRLSMQQLTDELDEFERQHMDQARQVMEKRLELPFRGPGNEVYVATVDGGPEMAGFVWFGVSDRPFSDVKVGWVYDIQVMPALRGKGVGEALMRYALKLSKKRGFAKTGLMVRANNKAAYSLYEKLGFEPEHILMTRNEADVSASNS
jgi:ribosomal protein S18 acetylase RimI-like enzyme